ncbi:Type IV pilus biogenesis and competence protein PilQ precursor [compost metagenome]
MRKSNISTLAVVGNDQTLLIGGYNSSQNSEQVDKVPFLGDIPGLGIFFSNKSKTVQRRERLFLIRPRVVAVNGEVVAQPGAASVPPMLDATWGGGAGMTAGQYLDLAQSQRTRVLFGPNVETGRVSVGPLRVSDWMQGVPVAQPVLQGKSSATQGPVIQVEPVAAPGTGRAP